MNQHRNIAYLSQQTTGIDVLLEQLRSSGFIVLLQSNLATFLGNLYAESPDLILIDLTSPTAELKNLVRDLKTDSYFSAIPVIGLISKPACTFPWCEFPLDDYLLVPADFQELVVRIQLSLCRIQRVFDNNPLTRLPGNTSVQNAITDAIGKPMAVCYLDINNFKPYNDVYGFSHGDEVLRMLGRIMFNAVKETGGGFSGHLGGDDFVFIIALERAELVCSTIINNFAAIAVNLFDDEEKRNGYYIALNRKGEEERFPLLSIAIAVIPTNSQKISHFGKVAELAAELKTLAKRSGSNCYVFDKRVK
jgi:diguanylate cyclase (GGDEF)-like protein